VASATSLSVYCGFDPTADSLHLGNLLGIIVLSWFQRCGHAPVALLGGATGRVGDPSGRSSERPVLEEETLEANVSAIREQLSSILLRNSAAGCPPVRVLNNLDWFGPMPFLTFLRDIGKFARVGTMMAKDSVSFRNLFEFVENLYFERPSMFPQKP
jgi:tyrosyl-tRNA synthetase